MPKYTYRGEPAKALVDTTPPHECLNPGDVFEVAETLIGDAFELLADKAAKPKSAPDSSAPSAPKEVK